MAMSGPGRRSDADTKIVPSWLVGNRDAKTGSIFMEDLASRFTHRVQLTTDGHWAYLEAVDSGLWDGY